MSVGFISLQISTRSKEVIKSLRTVVELAKGMPEREGNLCRVGSNTKLKSPPIIRCVFRVFGKRLKTLRKKAVSSKLGPYTLSSVTWIEESRPETIKQRALGLLIVDMCLKGADLRNKIATHLALDEKVDWNTWEIQLHLSRLCSECLICASCKNTMSYAGMDFK